VKYRGLNRVFRVYEGRRESLYVALTPSAAAKCHAQRSSGKAKGVKPEAVDPTRIIGVSFDDCTSAIAAIVGGNAELIRPSLEGIPLADEFIAIRRAAEQWALMTPVGETRLLTVIG
jgi:hypothetical protein